MQLAMQPLKRQSFTLQRQPKNNVPLQSGEARLQRIAASLPGAIYQFVWHRNGVVSFSYMSPGCVELFGLTAAAIEADAECLIALIHPDDRAAFDQSVALSAQELQPWQWEGRFVLPSGRIRWIHAASQPQSLVNGDICWDGLLMDITARKQAESDLQCSESKLRQQSLTLQETLHELQRTQAQLIQQEKMYSLGQLVAGIAHEINNPVNFIHGNIAHARQYIQEVLELLELYQMQFPKVPPAIEQLAEAIDLDFLKEDIHRLLSSMQGGTERIRGIVRSLRLFSRLDEAEVKAVDLHEGLESSLMLLDHRLQANSNRPAIQVVKEYEDLPWVECYSSHLNQVLMSLLENAIDALDSSESWHTNQVSPPGEADNLRTCGLQSLLNPTIWVRTEYLEDNRVSIRIADNGPGMTESVQQQLFNPFFTTKAVGKGTGLGLSVSYQIVTEQHQGQLHCVSAPGQGAEFIIQIPVQRL